MSILVFQHHPQEGPAALGRILQDHGCRLRTLHLYTGDDVPGDLDGVDGVVSMGGPMNVDQADDHPWMAQETALLKAAHEAGKPIVGICLGAQLVAAALGGKVAKMAKPEAGWGNVRLSFPGSTDPLYAVIGWDTMQFHMHGCEVTDLPAGAAPLAGSRACRTQSFKVGYRTYGFQYHFEWTRKDIEQFADDPLTTEAGLTAGQIVADCDKHYGAYRRLGDRLGERIALLLFPLDKR